MRAAASAQKQTIAVSRLPRTMFAFIISNLKLLQILCDILNQTKLANTFFWLDECNKQD